ncbi:MAG: MAPEG family protein [Hyphomicrobiales bacterium]|nr:MAPEG family protein [Hyphomicrobiales bacterium]
MPNLTALTTLLALLAYFWFDVRVGQARGKYGVKAPATSGDPNFERIFRAHQNMLEWMPIFIVGLWLFALYVSDRWAALIGLVWVGARIWYGYAYAGEASARFPAFGLQATAALILVLGALFGVVMRLLA